eukprot:664699-Prorocentrum_minimum.AAC.5
MATLYKSKSGSELKASHFQTNSFRSKNNLQALPTETEEAVNTTPEYRTQDEVRDSWLIRLSDQTANKNPGPKQVPPGYTHLNDMAHIPNAAPIR